MTRALARIDLAAVERNCAHLAATVGDGVELCAVVKADGYGHGADACARGGARRRRRRGWRSRPAPRPRRSAAASRTCRC